MEEFLRPSNYIERITPFNDELSHITKPVLNIIESYLTKRVCMDEVIYSTFIDVLVEMFYQTGRYDRDNNFIANILLFDNEQILFDVLDDIIRCQLHNMINWTYMYFMSPVEWAQNILDAYGDYMSVDADTIRDMSDKPEHIAIYNEWKRKEELG